VISGKEVRLGRAYSREEWIAIDSPKVQETGSSTREESEIGRVGEKRKGFLHRASLPQLGFKTMLFA